MIFRFEIRTRRVRISLCLDSIRLSVLRRAQARSDVAMCAKLVIDCSRQKDTLVVSKSQRPAARPPGPRLGDGGGVKIGRLFMFPTYACRPNPGSDNNVGSAGRQCDLGCNGLLTTAVPWEGAFESLCSDGWLIAVGRTESDVDENEILEINSELNHRAFGGGEYMNEHNIVDDSVSMDVPEYSNF